MTAPLSHIEPAIYVPYLNGEYDLPGPWRDIEEDLPGSPAGQRVFQLDRQFDDYRAEKLRSRRNHFKWYVCEERLPQKRDLRPLELKRREKTYSEVVKYIFKTLVTDYEDIFQTNQADSSCHLHCAHTGERLTFDCDWRLAEITNVCSANGHYRSALDALACQIQEDLAIIQRSGDSNSLLYAHVCMPSGWKPKRIVGQSFAAIHKDVAVFNNKAKKGESPYVNGMIDAHVVRVRFVWGLHVENRLNRHPDANVPQEFDSSNPSGFVRVERQTATGFRDLGIALFTIRVYLYDLNSVRNQPEHRQALCSAIRNMKQDTLKYKGLVNWHQPLLEWLESN